MPHSLIHSLTHLLLSTYLAQGPVLNAGIKRWPRSDDPGSRGSNMPTACPPVRQSNIGKKRVVLAIKFLLHPVGIELPQ